MQTTKILEFLQRLDETSTLEAKNNLLQEIYNFLESNADRWPKASETQTVILQRMKEDLSDYDVKLALRDMIGEEEIQDIPITRVTVEDYLGLDELPKGRIMVIGEGKKQG